MMLTPYRETLALPGIRSLLIVATLARIPVTAVTVVLTLRVTQDLGHGYGAAGLVGAAFTVGAALGAPVMGRITDRRGLRPVLALTTVAEATFWSLAQTVPYPVLVVAALIGGFLTLPVFSVARQSIAALAPESHRRPAFALDAVSTELSFMTGPALGVLLATAVNARVAMLAIGAGVVLSGIALIILDPPIRAHDEAPTPASERVPRRSWLNARLIAVLAVSVAATLVLSGTDVAIVATLTASGELQWTGAVLGLWAAVSMVGGFAYGAVRRPISPLLLVGSMAVLTLPVALGGGAWWLLALALLPAGALCAPSLSATADAVSRLAPPSARGEAMGLHNSSLTVGVALGAPLIGMVMDASAPMWGFVAAGGIGGLIALAVLPFVLRSRRDDTGLTAEPVPATDPVTESVAQPVPIQQPAPKEAKQPVPSQRRRPVRSGTERHAPAKATPAVRGKAKQPVPAKATPAVRGKATQPVPAKAKQPVAAQAKQPVQAEATPSARGKAAAKPVPGKATPSRRGKATKPAPTTATPPTPGKATKPAPTTATPPAPGEATKPASTTATPPVRRKATKAAPTKATPPAPGKATKRAPATVTPPAPGKATKPVPAAVTAPVRGKATQPAGSKVR